MVVDGMNSSDDFRMVDHRQCYNNEFRFQPSSAIINDINDACVKKKHERRKFIRWERSMAARSADGRPG
jgi:hypothetical protein